MNATESDGNAPATFRATVDLPLPDPPAIPIISGFDTRQNLLVQGLKSGVGTGNMRSTIWRLMKVVEMQRRLSKLTGIIL